MMRFIVSVSIALVCLAGLAFAAGLNGKWTFNLETDGGPRTASVQLGVDGEKVSGKWDRADVKGSFAGGKLALDFPLESAEAGRTANLKIKGTLEGNQITGTWNWEEYSGSFKASRAD
jgi:hypothetical protein